MTTRLHHHEVEMIIFNGWCAWNLMGEAFGVEFGGVFGCLMILALVSRVFRG